MAIPININNLINHTIFESSRIEFKSDWNPEAILHTICAFANDISSGLRLKHSAAQGLSNGQ